MNQTRSLLITVFFFLIISVIQFLYFFPNVDVGFHVEASKRILSGQKLYQDILLIGLPFQYLYRLPTIFISKYFDLDLALLNNLYTLAICLISLYLSSVVINNSKIKLKIISITCLLLFVIPFYLPDSQFGQKEHIICACLLPYYFLILFKFNDNYQSVKHNFLIKILALFSSFFKPHYFLIIITSEIYLFLRFNKCRKNIAKSTFLISFLFLLYLFIIEYNFNYLTFVNANYLTYSSHSSVNFDTITGNTNFLLFIVAILFQIFIRIKTNSSKLKHYIDIFLIFLILSFFIAVVQFKLWTYHFLPFYVFSILAFFIQGLCLESDKRNSNKILNAIILFLLTLNSLSQVTLAFTNHKRLTKSLKFIEQNKIDDIFLVDYSSFLITVFYKKNLNWFNKYFHLWSLESLHKKGSKKELDRYWENLRGDIVKANSNYIIIGENTPSLNIYYKEILTKNYSKIDELKFYKNKNIPAYSLYKNNNLK